MSEQRLLIRGGTVVSMDPAIGILPRGDLLIAGDTIREVAPRVDAADAEVLDARNAIVSPGFVDTHRHVWQTQLRTAATDWSLFDYFCRMRSVYGSFYSPEDVHLGNYVGALEALHAGITTIVDHSHIMNSPEHADEAVRGLRDAGIRGTFCYGLYPNPEHGGTTPPSLDPGFRVADARRVRAQHFAAEDALLVFGLAPTEVTATPYEVTRREIALGRELGARHISCHVAMGAYDTGRELVARLGRDGVLGPDLLLVHGAALTDEELTMIADAGASIPSTPEPELKMAMGHPVAVRAEARGAVASLGIDIVSNYSGDMFAQMRLLLQAQRGLENARLTAPPRHIRYRAEDVLRLATLGGARAPGMESRVGSLTPGKRADVVVTRCDAINLVPVHDPVGALVMNANAFNVDTVLVGGRPVKHGGRLVGVDWPVLAERVRHSAEGIVRRARAVPVEVIEAIAAPLMLREA